ncbi:MAG: hypothetical protein GY791_08655 [Alphaproteobacteria bacterium]|nr:hypothetical protein [Alphaproteobacteria bacterium]
MKSAFQVVLVFLLGAVSLPAFAADARPIEDFYGEYVGKSIAGSTGATGEDAEIRPRHLNISIQAHENGFTVAWLTIITSASGKTKAKSQLVNFRPTANDGLYASAMRRDTTGALVPLDPMSGDPYVWASINGDTLTVHALLVTADGGYEVQVYDRTLTEDGIDLTFRRFRDGVMMKEIEGKLTRVGD